MDDVELLNVENVCRLCLSVEEPKFSIFEMEDSPSAVPLVTKIQACLSLQILSTDKVSTLICSSCIDNVNQWYNYKEACFHSQDKLQKWLETHPQTNLVVVNIKEEPMDIDYCEDNNKTFESNSESSAYVTNHVKSMGKFYSKNEARGEGLQIDKTYNLGKDKDLRTSQSSSSKNANKEECRLDKEFHNLLIKTEPEDDYDTDCTIEIESVSGTELLLNPMAIASKEERIMEADSTQKSNATTPNSRKKMKRGPHTHFRGTRVYKQKCMHCQINLHSKHSYIKHMERFHSEDCENKNLSKSTSADEEELIEDVEDELTSMENDAPLTEVQQNIISQLKTFSCYSCQQTFNDRKHTLIHIRQHMPDLRPYTCIACLTQFRDRSMYKLHCSASFECAMKIALVIPKEGNEKYFTCNMCLRPMSNRKELLSHLSKHSDKQYEEMMSPMRSPPKLQPMTPLPSPKKDILPKSPQMSKAILGPYKNGDPAHNHPCNLCGMIYRYKPNMLRHHVICIRLSPELRTCYRCVHCGMTFLVFKKFHNHITIDHKKKEFVCFECNAKFKSPSDYLTHHEKHRQMAVSQNQEVTSNQIMSPHRGQSPLKSWSDNEEATVSRRSMEGQRYVCNLCGQDFTTRAKLASHKNLHLKVKIYSCVICRSMFSSAGALEIHMKDHGIEDPQERNANSSCVEYDRLDNRPQEIDTINTSTVSDTGGRENICNICGKIFSNYPNLRRHFRNIHKDNKARFTCIRCSLSFKTKELYEQHVKLDHKTKVMLMCSQCPKTFSFKANLDLHYSSAHGDKPGNRECDICGKVFLEEASLKIHRSWHNRANSRFYTRSFLNDEIKSLTPLSPTEINDNNLVASSPERPARARKSFPNPPPTKPQNDYQCQVCDSKFEDVVELRKHLWDVHCARNKPEKSFSGDELQCQLCTNIFPDQKSLKLHMDWHKANPILSNIQKQTFLCEICSKHYSSKKALTKHRKLHKANTVASIKFQSLSRKSAQYLCDVCRKIFSSNQSLQRHRMSFHNDLQSPRSQAFNSSTRRVSSEEYKMKKMDMEVREESSKELTLNAVNASKKPVTCHSCKKTFPNMSVLYKHKQLIHKPKIAKVIGKAPINECVPIQNADGRISCNICGKHFWSMSNFKQHFAAKHRNNSKSRCTTASCNPTYSLLSQSIKTESLPHKATIICCKLCNRHVWSREEIAIHMLSVHGTVYEPDTNSNFHRETDLTTYVVEGAVNATCPCCNIKYPNNRAMKIHYFKFHEATD
ncbi:PREDICTED: zinc finger protein 423-like [Polistes canadensis]|uniref:zinc finger protein 423-like n=1 Tax=Polistes canadensis TaxID=91411 RepID=UPI000718BC8B|nr:PREDICTED: zinc finger protein 423-like [Polistes canadensis]